MVVKNKTNEPFPTYKERNRSITVRPQLTRNATYKERYDLVKISGETTDCHYHDERIVFHYHERNGDCHYNERDSASVFRS